MLSRIWPGIILISLIFAIVTNNIEQLNNSIFQSTNEAIQVIITFCGTISLWSGIIKIIQETSLIELINKLLGPAMKFLFPNIKKEEKLYHEITMNMSANMLGLGNAATPMGIKAMKSLQEKNNNKEIITKDMMMFIILNTASIQIIPTTVIAIRGALFSRNPSEIILPVWIATIVSDLVGILAVKFFSRKNYERREIK